MLGTLPTTLNVNGVDYDIRTDFRNILQIITAFNAPELSEKEKAYVCLKRLFIALNTIPADDYTAAYEAAVTFIEHQIEEDRPSPRIVNWEKDEALIFSAINKVAGKEVRSEKYMHWWTFLGYFQSIDRNDTWGCVLVIRQKKAQGKKLEAYEKEFYSANRNLCSVDPPKKRKSQKDIMQDMFDSLLEEGGTE